MKILIIFFIAFAASIPFAFSTDNDTKLINIDGSTISNPDSLDVRLGNLYRLRNKKRDRDTPKGRRCAKITHYPSSSNSFRSSPKKYTTRRKGNLKRPLIVAKGDTLNFYSPRIRKSAKVNLSGYVKAPRNLEVSIAKVRESTKYITGTIGGLDFIDPNCICIFKNNDTTFVRLDLLYRFVVDYTGEETTLHVRIDQDSLCGRRFNIEPIFDETDSSTSTGNTDVQVNEGTTVEGEDDEEEEDEDGDDNDNRTLLSLIVSSDLKTDVELDIIIDGGIDMWLRNWVNPLIIRPLR